MKKITKSLLYTLAFILIVTTINACHSKGPYNPYLDMKVKPHQEEGKKTARAIRKAKKEYRKQLRSNRKAVFGKKVAPK